MSHSLEPISASTLLAQLHWRYAVKKFDATRKIDAAQWAALEESLVLTPSSFGLQPWKFIVLTNQEVKESLVPFAWGQRQLADASHVVIFAAPEKIDLDHFIEVTAATRGIPAESLDGFKKVIAGFIEKMSPEQIQNWAVRQIYIALGQFMASAALLGIDTCPMEGFEPAKVDEALGLPARGLRAAVIAVAGFRAADDKYAQTPKVRYPATEVIEHLA